MEKRSIDNRAAAIAAVQRNVQATRLGPQPPTDDPIIKVRRSLGFYDNLPWDDVQYFSMDDSDVVAAAEQVVWQYNVPAGQVLNITSVVFRMMLTIDVMNGWTRYAYAHDGYIRRQDYFSFTIAGTGALQRNLGDFFVPPAGGLRGDVYDVLNQDIMVPQLPFHLFANQGVDVVVTYDPRSGNYSNQALVGAEVRGLLISKVLFDKLRKEFGA